MISVIFDDGQKVEKNDLLVTLRHDQEQALIAELDAMLKEQRRQLVRLKDLQDGFSKRELSRKEWSELTTPELCTEAIDCLVRHGYLKEVIEKPNGRKKIIYLIHPDYKST